MCNALYAKVASLKCTRHSMGSQWRLPIYFHQLCVNKMSVHELASFCADVPLRTYSLFVHKQNQLNEAIRQRLSVMSPKESVTD